MKEIFKDIEGYEWKYQVSNLWRVKSIIKSELIQYKNRTWYFCVYLYKDSTRKRNSIHRLVWKAFIPNPENKPQINHIDWDKSNNCIDNLEWCNNSENQIHSYSILNRKTSKYRKWKSGKDHNHSKQVLQYDLNWNFIKEWWSCRESGRWIWLSYVWIMKVCNWKQVTAWWFKWKYK